MRRAAGKSVTQFIGTLQIAVAHASALGLIAQLLVSVRQQAKNADLTITLNRTDLYQVMMGVSSFDDLVKAGKARFDGDRKPIDQLRGLLVSFTPNFEILPGTAPRASAKGLAPFELPDMTDGD